MARLVEIYYKIVIILKDNDFYQEKYKNINTTIKINWIANYLKLSFIHLLLTILDILYILIYKYIVINAFYLMLIFAIFYLRKKNYNFSLTSLDVFLFLMKKSNDCYVFNQAITSIKGTAFHFITSKGTRSDAAHMSRQINTLSAGWMRLIT